MHCRGAGGAHGVAFIAFSSDTLRHQYRVHEVLSSSAGLEERMQWHLFPSPSICWQEPRGCNSCCPQPPVPAQEALEMVEHR